MYLYFQMNIENKNAISLQNQTKSEYYGHEPQLHGKIPSSFILNI